jgi:cytochrome o ubiquinol oxidase subunit 2
MDWLSHFILIFPSGPVALAERNLMFQALLFMLMVAVPVFGLIFFFAWHYRAGNTKAKYTPDWAHSNLEELIWWAIPLEIVLVLGALTWSSTHELDPRKPLSNEPPLTVEVIALDDKWLFIYPEEKVALVNDLKIPAGKPVEFRITSDAPMNSFWIPALGGQIYAMTGMVTELNLEAQNPGIFEGRSANYSGPGFAKMKFSVQALPQNDFNQWLGSLHASQRELDAASYARLQAATSSLNGVSFGMVDQKLFDTIVHKYGDPYAPDGEEHHHD